MTPKCRECDMFFRNANSIIHHFRKAHKHMYTRNIFCSSCHNYFLNLRFRDLHDCDHALGEEAPAAEAHHQDQVPEAAEVVNQVNDDPEVEEEAVSDHDQEEEGDAVSEEVKEEDAVAEKVKEEVALSEEVKGKEVVSDVQKDAVSEEVVDDEVVAGPEDVVDDEVAVSEDVNVVPKKRPASGGADALELEGEEDGEGRKRVKFV